MQDASVTCLFPLPIWVAYFQRELSLTPALSLWERESVPPLLAGEGPGVREKSYFSNNPCSLATRMAAARDLTPSLS